MHVKGKEKIVVALDIGYKICQLDLFDLYKKEEASILGNIYIGKVKNIAENIRAAFIEIENGTVCYYSLEEKAEPFFVNQKKNNRVCIGDELLVQVCREPIRGKLPCVTCDLNLAGRYVVLTSKFEPLGFSGKLKAQRKQELRELLQAHLPEDAGVILRTNSAHAEGGEILEELDKLYGQLKEIQKKSGMRTCFSKLFISMPPYLQVLQNLYADELEEIVTDDKELFETIQIYLEHYGIEAKKLRFYQDDLLPLCKVYSIEKALKEALSEKVWLKSGGFLVIQQTEAFVSIDVNTGKYTGKKEVQETYRKINLEAAGEIARQLRMRNLSGMILIDFINLKREEDKKELMHVLQRYLNEDPVKGNVVDITKLNIVEVTRKKIKKSLAEELAEE